MLSETQKERLKKLYLSIDRVMGGAPEIIRIAVVRFNEVRGAEAAASIAYYALFSLFPLLLALVSILGFVLVNVQGPGQVLSFISEAIPISADLLENNLREILAARSTLGLVGLAGVIWAASGVFLTLSRNINRAWPGSSLRNMVESRVLAVLMIAALSLLLILSVTISTIFSLLPRFEIPIGGSLQIYQSFLYRMISSIIPAFVLFLVFLGLYRWIPTTRVRFREAAWGALFAALAIEIGSRLFTWYLGTSFARFELLYGSLGTIIVLMSWIYLGSVIILFGAHISAAVAIVRRLRQKGGEE